MQTFIDSTTQQVYAFEDDVKVVAASGIYSFETATGALLNVPVTLQPYVVPVPTAAQIAAQQAAQALASSVQAALSAGLTITSTSTPAVNGIYPLDINTQNEIGQVTLFTQVNGDFPGGVSSYPWFDTSNVPHVFPSVALHDEWATAIANYVAALKLYGAGVAGAALPPSSITIA